jgi:hypothetical protein
MSKRSFFVVVLLAGQIVGAREKGYFGLPYGQLLPGTTQQVGLWWASSGWKISRDKPMPEATGQAIIIRAARNEAEAAQLVVRAAVPLKGLVIRAGELREPGGGAITSESVEVLKVRYVDVTHPTDNSSVPGLWPDPLPPVTGPVDLAPKKNQPFWVRVKVPRQARAGIYTGIIKLSAENYAAQVVLQVEVYDFVLPDRMTCTTAFGFSPETVFQYQNLSDNRHKRQVLDEYWEDLSEHHISPYNPAPLDSIGVTWPNIRPPERKWEGGLEVTNEKHSGQRSLLVFDDRKDFNVNAAYKPLIKIPGGGLRLRFWYRTAVPKQAFLVTLNHYDASGNWISGANNDMSLEGNGLWQQFDRIIDRFPEGAKSVQVRLWASMWTEDGQNTGLVWFDDVSLIDTASDQELIEGGDFEPPVLPEPNLGELRVAFDFSAWDKAMARAIEQYNFNSFTVGIPGLGGGTFHSRQEPELLGFTENTSLYKIIFAGYCRQIQEHLREKGWLDKAYVYWFDEPDPKDYEFVMNGFAKLKTAAPDISRMLTEQVENALIGGPNIWCPVTYNYKHEPAEQRRQHGEKFWWYVCTGPKAPYCTLFIDHPGTELRVWLWQSWKNKIDGILVWETNYWTSSAAYPDPEHPQNPYEDPMGWVSGYSTGKGIKKPWGNGDGRFIYPPEAAADSHPPTPILEGPVDSIRWEMLRDGIEDYEYLAILSRLLKAKKDKLTDGQYQQHNALLEVPADITKDMTVFTEDPAPIEARRDQIAKTVVVLSRL